jgi:[acyl-carrier-protein] S-malonyltransferase
MHSMPIDSACTAVLFPGQGAQVPEMRAIAAEHAPELCSLCLQLLGADPFARVSESTRFAQPAIYCASIAAWRSLAGAAPPLALAGHSLGEISALAAAGAFTPEQGLTLAIARGRLMAEASEQGEPQGMLALRAPTAAQLEELSAYEGVYIANRNSPRQVVLAGTLRALRQAGAHARELGVRSLELDVRGAYHTPLMAPAKEPFEAVLAELPIAEPKLPVYSCISAAPMRDIRAELADALLTPVDWHALMAALWSAGARTFIDVGPGRVLAGLTRQCLPEAHAWDLQSLRESGLRAPGSPAQPEPAHERAEPSAQGRLEAPTGR